LLSIFTGIFRASLVSRIFSTQGHFQQLSLVHYSKDLGSDYKFTKTSLDLRYFTSRTADHIFAMQSLLEFTADRAPFLELAELGNQIRAFSSERFIDNHLILSRIEYRTFPIKAKFFNRLGFALFAESGQVSPSLDEFQLKEVKTCLGGGFRFSVFPEERYNLRFDLGFSNGERGINIGFGEEF